MKDIAKDQPPLKAMGKFLERGGEGQSERNENDKDG